MHLKNQTSWNWHTENVQSLNKIKKVLASKLVLRFYDVTKPVTIQTDACQSDLGCCLIHGGQPVHYASRAMTEAEKSYAQTEKELRAT